MNSRNGCLKPGDRVLAIDGVCTNDLSCEKTTQLLSSYRKGVSLYIEYDIADLGGNGRQGSGPFVIEIGKLPSECLGADLVSFGDPDTGRSRLLISQIRDGSIADRCGALQVGDVIEAINGISTNELDVTDAIRLLDTSGSAMIKLLLMPCPENNELIDQERHSNRQPSEKRHVSSKHFQEGFEGRNLKTRNMPPVTDSLSFPLKQGNDSTTGKALYENIDSRSMIKRERSFNIPSRHKENEVKITKERQLAICMMEKELFRLISGVRFLGEKQHPKVKPTPQSPLTLQELLFDYFGQLKARKLALSSVKLKVDYPVPSYNPTNELFEGGAGLCRTEEVEVVLEADRNRRTQFPYGFSLQALSPHTRNDEPLSTFPVITNVIPSGPAYQSGVIQPGDLLMSIQGDSPLGKSIDKLNARYSLCDDQRCPGRLAIVTQYTVADNVIPNCGVFDVRIIKRSASLGINLQASVKSRPGEPLLISKVIPGSVASRCGSISPGDILLAVNGVSLEACGINEAVQLLQNSDELITLRIKKPGGQSASLPRPSMLEYNSHNHQFLDCSEDNDMSSEVRTRTSAGQFDALSASGSSENLFSETVGWSQGVGRLHHCQRNTAPRRTMAENVSCAATANSYSTAVGVNAPVGVASASEAALEQVQNQTCSHPGERRSKSSSRRRSRAAHPPTEESGSSELRMNVSETSSSDWFSEAFSSDKHMEILRVRLTRPFPSCPWGIIISGTDDVSDAPVVIDSLTPGKPGAISGLLRPGDQILAVNDVSATHGLTLSQVMARLQLPSEQVLFYIARPVGEAARQLNTSRTCSTRDDSTTQLLNVKQQSSSVIGDNHKAPGHEATQPTVTARKVWGRSPALVQLQTKQLFRKILELTLGANGRASSRSSKEEEEEEEE
ncbi:unnamed protein product [Schistocephalus solidus]|uniref:Inactivation-no-after-D protein n=1 Tax=Schistocephalus solidus TaxID=70667 RepID=A0A183SE26_SCHSO|nr:unnamed protein product [Schistocephalus solidus]